jgi:hypothetical protein
MNYFRDGDRKSKEQTRDKRFGLKNNEIPPLARVCLCINEILQLASFLRMLDKKMHNRQ